MKRLIIILVILAGAGGGAGWYYTRAAAPVITVNTSPVTRGEVVDAVGSTGTLQAVTTVQVGSQVSGQIAWLGADFNSIVTQGQLIAKLDPALVTAQLEASRANLTQSRANQTKAQVDLERLNVSLTDAQQKYARAKELNEKSLVPQSDLDAAKTTLDTAQANIKGQMATLTQVAAAVQQAEAAVNQNQVNLDHTIITAPIDGIVTQRSVDVGQTVNAGMNAPTLFIIAADLTKMQVSANIDESDVGRIRPGQRVTFRVDAYPTQQFVGEVRQIRLQPVVQSNVTSYGTIITVPNPELKLKPGMTANLRVEVHRRDNVLRVPNAALRFRPTADMFAALNQEVPPEAQAGRGGAGRAGGAGPGRQGAAPGQGDGQAQAGGQRQGGGAVGNGDAPANAGRAAPAAGAPAAAASAQPGVAVGGNQQPGQNAGQAGQGGGGRRGGDGGGSVQGGGGQGGGNVQGRGNGQGGDGNFQGRGGQGRGGQGGQQGGRGGNAGGPGGGGGGRGGGQQGGGANNAQMLERFRAMTPEQQQQFVDRMKGRGQDTSAFEAVMAGGRGRGAPAASPVQGATTIDALFAPVPATESQGRVWMYDSNKQLKSVAVRLGITDGTNSELLSDGIEQSTEVVTALLGVGSVRPTLGGGNQGTGNPFQQGNRGGGPPPQQQQGGGGRGR